LVLRYFKFTAICASVPSSGYNKLSMAPYSPLERKANGSAVPQGPHPSIIQVAKPYVFEQRLQKCMTEIGVTEAKEDTIRLQGVTWIDNVRKALQL